MNSREGIMNHIHYQELTSQFVDREIRPEDEQELFAHLGSCIECREFLKASCRLQIDMAATKRMVLSPSGNSSRYFVADRNQVHQMYPLSRSRSTISTLVLFAMVTLIVAVLFSTSVKAERFVEVAPQELMQSR